MKSVFKLLVPTLIIGGGIVYIIHANNKLKRILE